MSEIILKVQGGNKCEGCMFLDIDLFETYVECLLFNARLEYTKKYGDIDISTIQKHSSCPTGGADE